MCKAHVLRFSCGHGVLMGLEACRLGPCPMLKTTGARLPQQPYRCYNCQHKRESNAARPPFARHSTSISSIGSNDSGSSASSSSSSRRTSPPRTCDPLPGVARQPAGSVRMSLARAQSAPGRLFSFTCSSSNHYTTPHYSGLPNFLPHQDHPCPPCQISELRVISDEEVSRNAAAEFPNLKEDMLVRNGVIREWQTKPSLEKYVAERRTEDREMWLHVTRKWTQDLKKARILVAEEDGLGLLA